MRLPRETNIFQERDKYIIYRGTGLNTLMFELTLIPNGWIRCQYVSETYLICLSRDKYIICTGTHYKHLNI